MAERPIYLDHFASTPIDPRVLDAMLPYLKDRYGHPGSRSHVYGWEAEQALEAARARVADLIHADPAEIVFTSGGTEADNLAVKGVAEAYASRGRHVVTSAVEARPVLDATQALADRAGGLVTRVPVDARGRLDEAAFAAALHPDTVLACVTAADAEVGTIQPIAACGAACATAGVLLHVEAAYASPWVSLDVRSDGVHLLSLSAHRLGGPKGAGALYVRRREPRVRLVPLFHGGGHERGLRPGAPDVAAVVGFGVAAELARVEREARSRRVAALRDRFESMIRARLAGVTAHGDPRGRLPNVSSLAFDGVEAEALLMGMPTVAASSGAGCTSATLEPSHVLRALGVPDPVAHQTVRFSLGFQTTDLEIDRAIEAVLAAVARVRSLGAPPPVRPHG